MAQKEQKLWYLGLLTSLSGSLLIACAVQSVNATDSYHKVLWIVFYILSGIVFFGISNKSGKIMEVPELYIRGLQAAMIVIIIAGVVTIYSTDSIIYGSIVMSQIAMWPLETYASIGVAFGTILLALITYYLALQTKKAVQVETKMKCRELHTIELRAVIHGIMSSLPIITPPDQLRPSTNNSIETSESNNPILEDDLKNHLPKEQNKIFEELEQFRRDLNRYIEESNLIFKNIIIEVQNRTNLIYNPGLGKDGSFSEHFIVSLYYDAFQIAKGQRPVYSTIDYEIQSGGTVWLKRYGIAIIHSENQEQREKGQEVFTSMRKELINSEYVQEAKKILEKQQELNLKRDKILNDLRIIVSIPILPGDCKFIRYCMGQ